MRSYSIEEIQLVIASRGLQKKRIKTIRKRKLLELFLFIAATQWSFIKFILSQQADNTDLHSSIHPSIHSFIHSFIKSDSNAVVLQGKVHQFNSNLVVSHEECQTNLKTITMEKHSA